MKGKRHQWKCCLVLLLAIALIGSNVDYTMLSASAQGTDSRKETGAEGTEAGKMSFLSGASLEPDETNPEEPDAGTPADVDLEAADENETVKAEPENPDESDEKDPADVNPEDVNAEMPANVDLNEADRANPAEGTPEEPGGEASAGADQKKSDAGTPDIADSEDAASEDGAGDMESAEIVIVPEVDLPGNDELFAGYVEELFYGDSGISLYGNMGGASLTGTGKEVYDALKPKVEAVAKGELTSTKFVVNDVNYSGAATADDVKPIIVEVVNYLLMDCPFDLYWFDKTAGYRFGVSSGVAGKLNVTISFAVAQGYKGSNDYEVNASQVAAANTAASNAKAIAGKYAGKSDYEKLDGFRKEICDLVSYNQAAASTATAYGDPWQLVWVFDGDENTNVVCEGYSKAFQYLCDLSGFKGCYTVTGTMSGGTGAGGHMWNIVRLGGKNYLVDVTNCDAGTIGSPDKLFLAGASGSVAAGYTCSVSNPGGSTNILYKYDANEVSLFDEEILTLSSEKYSDKGALKVTAPTGIEVIFGDSVNDVLNGKGGSAVDSANNAVAGKFQWDASVTSYGTAGTKTLKAVFVPDDSSYNETGIEVTVTVNPKPITVTADSQTKVYGSADPELTYTASGVVSGYPLSGQLERAAGEDVKADGYKISQGTLTNETNTNYDISFIENTLKITPATCTETVEPQQNILVKVGDFLEPSYTGVKGEKVEGKTTYSYGNQSYTTYDSLKAMLATLTLGEKVEISYAFQPDSANYNGAEGTITFTAKDIVFQVGNDPATVANAVTVKTGAAYGDSWSNIVTISNLTAVAGIAKDNDQSHFSLNKTDMPDAGTDQSFEVLYNGSVGGKEYKDVVVCSGTVNVNPRIATVTAGSYKVSKVYDKTTAAGNPTGAISLSNLLQKDVGTVKVIAVPEAYTNPNVGGQATVKATLTLDGAASANYRLSNTTLDVPCEITPMPITPTLEPLGSYDYTGSAITPALTVKNGDEPLAASDYEAVWSNNVNAGTAKVEIKPAAGGNYTWSADVSGTFAINKVAYTGEKARSISVRFGGELNLDLTPVLPAGYQLGKITVADEEKIFESGPVMTAAALSGRLVYNKENVGKTATITIPVTNSTNFLAYDYVVTVAVADKMEQTGFGFTSAVLNKAYGDGDFSVSVVNAAQGSKVTFTSSNPEVAQIDEAGKVHILRAGTAVLQAQASETDEYFGASANCILNVVPKALAWNIDNLSAIDKEGAVNGNKATLYGELKVSGILEADAADVVFSCPAAMLTGTYAAVNAGIQNVTLTWANPENPAKLQGSKAGNYKLPETLPGFTGKINAVRNDLPAPAESTAAVQYSLSMEMGISQVPQAFLGLANLNTPEKIEEQMQLNIQNQPGSISSDDIAVYDVVLMVNVNGTGWVQADKNNFPAGGLTVTLPYPQGTSRNANDFVVCHLFTEDMNGHRAGETEYPAVEKTAEGIRFKVYGLSPISVGWKDIEKTDDTKNPDTGNSGGSQNQAAASAVGSPKTSDNNHIEWYLLSMVVSGSILGGMFIWNKKRKKG